MSRRAWVIIGSRSCPPCENRSPAFAAEHVIVLVGEDEENFYGYIPSLPADAIEAAQRNPGRYPKYAWVILARAQAVAS